MYFAWTYPYSFEESLEKSRKIVKKFQNHDYVYIHREVVCYSKEKRPMEMLTITGKSKQTANRESLMDGLFPESGSQPESRPFIFDKPTIFISS